MRGRKPKPTALKKLMGNPGKRKLNHQEPKLPAAPSAEDAGGAKMPRGLLPAARSFWQEHYPMLAAAGVLKASDLPAFELLCRAWAMIKECDKQLEDPANLVQCTDSGYEAPSAWVSLRKQYFAEFKGLCTLFGLTPSDRARIKTPIPEKKKDAIEDALAGGDGEDVIAKIGRA